MNDMKLSYFTNDESFPLFVQFGAHDVPLFVHGHEDFYELVTVLDGRPEEPALLTVAMDMDLTTLTG